MDYHYCEGWQTESVDIQGLFGTRIFDWDRRCRSNHRLWLRLGPRRDRLSAGLSHLHASAACVHSLAHEFETKCRLVWMLRRLQENHHFRLIVGVSGFEHGWGDDYINVRQFPSHERRDVPARLHVPTAICQGCRSTGGCPIS